MTIVGEVRLESFGEGLLAEVMRPGDERPTVKRLHEFIREKGCEPAGKHHEIPRRTAPKKMKTVMRQPVK